MSDKRRCLTELRGLSKQVWDDQDAQSYINQTRDEWNSEDGPTSKPIEELTDDEIEAIARALEDEGGFVTGDIRASLRQARAGDVLPADVCLSALKRDIDHDIYWKPVQRVYRKALAAGKSEPQAEELAQQKLNEIWKDMQS